MALIVAILGAAAFASCAKQREERFPVLVEGRDWFAGFTPTPVITVTATVAPTIEAAPSLTATPLIQELDTESVENVAERRSAADAGAGASPPAFRPASAAQLSESEIESALRDAGWPDELLAEAKRVAHCESRWHPGSVNSSSGVTGLFQLWSGWYGYAGVDFAQWADPVVNARAALGAYRYSNGWAQWACKP